MVGRHPDSTGPYTRSRLINTAQANKLSVVERLRRIPRGSRKRVTMLERLVLPLSGKVHADEKSTLRRYEGLSESRSDTASLTLCKPGGGPARLVLTSAHVLGGPRSKTGWPRFTTPCGRIGMPVVPDFEWKSYQVPADVADRQAFGRALRRTLPDEATQSVDIPDLSQRPQPIDKAKVLLAAAAEVEHALLVQYRYAAFSLNRSSDVAEQQNALERWSLELHDAERLAQIPVTTSFARDVLPLFRQKDIDHMKAQNLDLAKFDAVRGKAASISARLKRTGPGRMPPAPDRPLTPEQIALFDTWIAEGCPP
jgi:hypothetical protein